MEDGSFTEDDHGDSESAHRENYVVTGQGSWGDDEFWDPVLLLEDLDGEDIRRTPIGEYGQLLKREDGHSPLHFVSGVAGLKEWYKKKTWLAKATSKAEGPPKLRHLRKILSSSWNHNGAGASMIFTSLSKRPVLSSSVVALKALMIVHKLIQQGSPDCLSSSYLKISLLRDIGNTWACRPDSQCKLISAYASMLIAKVTFHHRFPDFKSNYSVDVTSAGLKGHNCEFGNETPIIQGIYCLQKLLEETLCALQTGFLHLEDKYTSEGGHKGNESTVISELGNSRPGTCNGTSDSIELVVAALVPILKEADLLYDICWYLLSAVIPGASSKNSGKQLSLLSSLLLKFEAQHKILRHMYERARSEPAIICRAAPPVLPAEPAWATVVSSTLLQDVRNNVKEINDVRETIAFVVHPTLTTVKNSNNPEGSSCEQKGESELLGDEFIASHIKTADVLADVGSSPRSSPLTQRWRHDRRPTQAAAAAVQRFAAGRAEAGRAVVASELSPELRNFRLEPPPNDSAFNVLVDVSTSRRSQKPQHTRMWSSFDDASFFHKHYTEVSASAGSSSPLQVQASPLFYSPRGNPILHSPVRMPSPAHVPRETYTKGSVATLGIQMGKFPNVVVSVPGEALIVADTVALQHQQTDHIQQQIEHMQLQIQQQQQQLQQLQQERAYQEGSSKNIEEPAMVEFAAANPSKEVPLSWQFGGSMSDLSAWQDFSIDRSAHAAESLTEVPLAAQWEIAFSELKFGPKIGQGAFGDVIKGTWQGTDVAVKRIQNVLASNFAQALADFKREVAVVMKLRHPNIILFMGACTLSPEICIVMEYAANGSLYSVLHNPNVTIDMNTVVRWATEAARGMNYLHTRTPVILHRDLKSVNLLVDADWHIKVSDFGLAMTKQNSHVHSQVGTWGWMAPEVLESAPYDEKADVYSFGIVLWELITREEPFKGFHPMQIMRAIDRGERLQIPESSPAAYRDLILDCWKASPQDRPSFEQILQRLTIDSCVITKSGSMVYT